jgi:hypothetical protein
MQNDLDLVNLALLSSRLLRLFLSTPLRRFLLLPAIMKSEARNEPTAEFLRNPLRFSLRRRLVIRIMTSRIRKASTYRSANTIRPSYRLLAGYGIPKAAKNMAKISMPKMHEKGS